MIIQEVPEEQKVQFDKLVQHPVQSWEWGTFREKTGNKVFRLGLYDANKLREAYILTTHKIPKTKFSVGMFTQSPVPTQAMLKGLRSFGKDNNLIFVRMEPRVVANIPQKEYDAREIEKLLRVQGAVPGKPFFNKSNFLIDLTKTEEELLKSMHPKTRYNIRLAQRHGVEIVEDNSQKAFETYLSLMDDTTRRQKYYAHTEQYHKLMWTTFYQSGIAHLLTARHRGEILSTWILFKWHDSLYYPYGASSDKHREAMASTLMMWEAIRFGKKHGLKTFDLWGSDEGKGYTRFKESFGPQKVEFIGAWDLIINPYLYHLYRLAEETRWRLLKIKAQILPVSSFR